MSRTAGATISRVDVSWARLRQRCPALHCRGKQKPDDARYQDFGPARAAAGGLVERGMRDRTRAGLHAFPLKPRVTDAQKRSPPGFIRCTLLLLQTVTDTFVYLVQIAAIAASVGRKELDYLLRGRACSHGCQLHAGPPEASTPTRHRTGLCLVEKLAYFVIIQSSLILWLLYVDWLL